MRMLGVKVVQGKATADQAVAGRARAITERAANGLGVERPFLQRVGQDRWIGQKHAAQANRIGPTVADHVLCHVRQVFLEVAVGRANDHRDRYRVKLLTR